MAEKLFVVDSFTQEAFRGNPAAVVFLERQRDDQWMRSFAAEMRHSETAFMLGDNLRWFTPVDEVDLCGHATLATAHALGRSQTFHTLSGPLYCDVRGDGWISMDFPRETTEFTEDSPDVVLPLLGDVEVLKVWTSPIKTIVEVTEASIETCTPDFAEMMRQGRGRVVLTAQSSEPGIDYLCRYFCPVMGINEDPATGRAYCLLGPYWQDRLGKDEMVARQASQRGAIIRHRLEGERVAIMGQATTIFEGELRI